LRHSLRLDTEARAVEAAIAAALESGALPADVAGPEERAFGTVEVGNAVLSALALHKETR
jgi:3-isopropylmalate dehydrogenase